ncbi:MAG: (d)CMP kinase [Phycisphaerales bacterium]|nr:(d)CMP kinase [Phycisphaerales bacterium]
MTIDGPAGTGKTTVAAALARRLGLELLDTGAMYRAAALIAIEQEIPPTDGPALARAVEQSDMHFTWGMDRPRLLIGERDVSERIRDLDVTDVVSIVASQPEVRRVLVAQQRRIAHEHRRLVTEGRDQGSVVFPDAPVRFYLDAPAHVRASRRTEEYRAKGKTIDAQAVRDDIERRDRIDTSRLEAPLTCPPGAIVVDTARFTVDNVVDELERHVREQVPGLPVFDEQDQVDADGPTGDPTEPNA